MKPFKFIFTLLLLLLACLAVANNNKTPFKAADGPPNLQQQTLNLNSSDLGFMGPLNISFEYSDQLGYLFDARYSHAFDPYNTMLLEAAFGNREYRLAGTWGHQLTLHQRIKFTAERLAQKIDFGFTTGNVRQWIGQNAIGAGYQYLLQNRWLQSFNLTGYYAKAENKNLAPVIFVNGTQMNFRHIAGATSTGASAGVDIQPWPTGLFTADLNYDDVDYDNIYQAAPDAEGLGETLTFQQLLTRHLKLILLQSNRKIYKQYKVGLDWLIPTRPGTQLQMGIAGTRIISDTAIGNEDRIMVNVGYSWGGTANTPAQVFAAPSAQINHSLATWTAQPAVRMEQVLAVADQKTVAILPQGVGATTAKPKTKAEATENRVINVKAGEKIDIPIAGYAVSEDSLKPLHLKYENHHIIGKLPKDLTPKNYQLELIPSTKPLTIANNKLLPLQKSTLTFHVTTNPKPPKIIEQIPDFFQSIDNPSVSITLNQNTYFENQMSDLFPMSLSFSGLPSNLTTSKQGDIYTISGTVTQANVDHGPYTITVTAYDGPPNQHNPAYETSQTFKLSILPKAPVYHGPTQLPDGVTTKAYGPVNFAADFSGYQVSVKIAATSLPPGLKYNNGKIQGTPTHAGDYPLEITASNSGGEIHPQVEIHIEAAPHYNGPAELPTGAVSDSYMPYSLKQQFSPATTKITIVTNSLPPGLSFNNGTLSGTPTQGGKYTLDISATNAGVTIHPNITIPILAYKGPHNLPGGKVDSAYSYNLQSQFVPQATHIKIDPSTLPLGLTYSSGIIHGTPTHIGDYALGVTATYNNFSIHPKISLTIDNAKIGHLACPDPWANPAKKQSYDGVKTYYFTGAKSIAGKHWYESSLKGHTYYCKYTFNDPRQGVTIHTQIVNASVKGSSKCKKGRLNSDCMVTITYHQ